MKLIDDLTGGIPEREGWHDSWVFAYRRKGGENIYYTSNKPISFDEGFEYVSREQYEAALAASNHPEWDGEGLPPVGCVCEIAPPIHDAGTKVRVLCHDENAAVCRIIEGDRLHSLCQLEITEIRPVRTESERRRDGAILAMRESLGHAAGLIEVGNIYRAIAAGKIPGIRLTDDAGN